MESVGSRPPAIRTAHGAPSARAVKVLVAGGFGVGKTTMVSTISEITPLQTEELISEVSSSVDDLAGIEHKTSTTVALDFGRLTIEQDLVLYLFGTPGQDRFWFMWDDLADGAIGAVVLADTRRLDGCFPTVDFFEQRKVPFVVGVNCFDGAPVYTTDEVRQALDLDEQVPVLLGDVRLRSSSRDLLLALCEQALRRQLAEPVG